MDSLVRWKKRRDRFQDSDRVEGMGDNVGDFDDMERPSLTGSPTEVKFISKDETNATAMRRLKIRW